MQLFSAHFTEYFGYLSEQNCFSKWFLDVVVFGMQSNILIRILALNLKYLQRMSGCSNSGFIVVMFATRRQRCKILPKCWAYTGDISSRAYKYYNDINISKRNTQ